MRKKDLLAQNVALFESLQKAELENKRLNSQIVKLSAIIESMKSGETSNVSSTEIFISSESEDIENLDFSPVSEPILIEEEPVPTQAPPVPEVSDIVNYGAEIIGRIVIEAAKYSNQLTADGNTKYIELVNLLLGKTEVAKSDILTLPSSLLNEDDKKNAINKVFDDTLEYFQSVMAQKN